MDKCVGRMSVSIYTYIHRCLQIYVHGEQCTARGNIYKLFKARAPIEKETDLLGIFVCLHGLPKGISGRHEKGA